MDQMRAYWNCNYDDWYRLLTANRYNSFNQHIKAAYSYTYDDGDNMLADRNAVRSAPRQWPQRSEATRAVPLSVSRYPAKRGKPGDAGGFAARRPPENTSSASAWVMRANTDADLEMSFRYLSEDTSNNGYYVYVYPRYVDTNNRVMLYILPNKVTLSQVSGGTYSVLDEDTGVTTAQDTWYDYRVVCDGANIEVWRSTGTAMPTKVLETSSCAVTSTANIGAVSTANSYHEFDDIRIHSDSLSNTTTFAVNNANELSTMTDPNGTTTFGFDDWGRMTTKARGSYSATYGYRYGQMLCSVESDFPGDGSVTYTYRCDNNIYGRTNGDSTSRYKWARQHRLVSVEDEFGTVESTMVGNTLGESVGATPESGQWQFYTRNNIDSVCATRSISSALIGKSEFGPHGDRTSSYGIGGSKTYTNHLWDKDSGLYLTTFRTYSPHIARWIVRDPLRLLDGLNLYAYVTSNPIRVGDCFGLKPNEFDIACDDFGVSISYDAPEGAACEHIKFVQITKQDPFGPNTFAGPNTKWHIDENDPATGKAPDSPYYPFPSGKPRGNFAGMTDEPEFESWFGTQYFETCAVCAKGKDKGKIYGCRKWQATTGATGGLTYKGCEQDLAGQKPSQTFLNLLKGKL